MWKLEDEHELFHCRRVQRPEESMTAGAAQTGLLPPASRIACSQGNSEAFRTLRDRPCNRKASRWRLAAPGSSAHTSSALHLPLPQTMRIVGDALEGFSLSFVDRQIHGKPHHLLNHFQPPLHPCCEGYPDNPSRLPLFAMGLNALQSSSVPLIRIIR